MWPLAIVLLGLYGVKRFFDAKKAATPTAPVGYTDGAPPGPDALAPSPDQGGGGSSGSGGGGGGGSYDGFVPPPAAPPVPLMQLGSVIKKAIAAKPDVRPVSASSPAAQQSFASRVATLPTDFFKTITPASAPAPVAPVAPPPAPKTFSSLANTLAPVATPAVAAMRPGATTFTKGRF